MVVKAKLEDISKHSNPEQSNYGIPAMMGSRANSNRSLAKLRTSTHARGSGNLNRERKNCSEG